MGLVKGKLLAEGKTKKIWSANGLPDMVIIESKDDITKNDDPSQTRIVKGKGQLANATTCAMFQLLKDAGVPVAFEEQLRETEFLSPTVAMIPLEIIWRRYAVGSFLKRHPELGVPEGEMPYRFHRSVFELFLKTTGGVIRNWEGREYEGLITLPLDDPFIANPYEKYWDLFHPKKPAWDSAAFLGVQVFRSAFLPENVSVEDVERLTRRAALVLEGAWAQLGYRFIDIKFEMGVTPDGQLVIADVVDADSWRLRDSDWNELSKQLFRDGADMDKIMAEYTRVAQLVKQLRIPKQAIVIWRGSDKDPKPETSEVAGVDVVDLVISGHKSPVRSLRKLKKVLTQYPEGGVILACIGMSNGLGPTLAARVDWPVIGVVMTADKFPDDVWSNLRMPSQVPMATMLSPGNAVLMAFNILAQKNPAAYAERRLAIEELDD